MTRISLLVLVLSLAGCGGGKKAADKPAPKPDTAATDTAAKSEPAPPPKKEEPPPPPPPKMFHAKATLDPVKGAKQKAATITLAEEDGKTSANGSFAALKPGKYHVVAHDGSACGKNGASAGKAGTVDVAFEVKKGDAAGNVEQTAIDGASLDGDSSMVGKVLALHADAKGKPGALLACGVVSKVEDEDDAAKKE